MILSHPPPPAQCDYLRLGKQSVSVNLLRLSTQTSDGARHKFSKYLFRKKYQIIYLSILREVLPEYPGLSLVSSACQTGKMCE